MFTATEISNCGFKKINRRLIIRKLWVLIFLFLSFHPAFAQTTPSADDLFQQARKTAFEMKDYVKAKLLAKKALEISPDYSDIRIFLGRVYAWSKQPDSARVQFETVIKKHPEYEDAWLALATLEYWNGKSPKALKYVENGLKYHPGSKDLLLLKVRVLSDLRKYGEADQAIDTLSRIEPNSADAKFLGSRIKDKTIKNKVALSYDYIYFDKQYKDPWQLTTLDYTRQTPIGSVIVRLNYANRFNNNGTQVEFDAYPHISRTFYAYINAGYSSTPVVFPKSRAGFSLYAVLPSAFEAEAGFRYLDFGTPTWIYTASISKYYKSFWFNLRGFITPSSTNNGQFFSLNARYYYAGVDDYLALGISTGISPDDSRNNILLNNSNNYKLRSNGINGGYRHAFNPFNIVFVNLSWANQEYLPLIKGNQIDAGIGYIRRF